MLVVFSDSILTNKGSNTLIDELEIIKKRN